MRKRVLSVILSAMLTIGFTNVYANETVTALYGGDINGGDAYEFAITMRDVNNCLIKEIDQDATVKQFKDAGEKSTFIYWSGHGLPSGRMSCYGIESGGNGMGDYINYDNPNAPVMHDEIGSDISYDQYGHFFLGNTAWDGRVKYVILAACNQIGTSSSLTTEWKRTMYGTNRVNMIFGYYGSAPGDYINDKGNYRDNLIAIDFAKKMKDNSIKKSWHLANSKMGIYYSALLYNEKASYDTITNMRDLTIENDPHPTIILEKVEDLGTMASMNFSASKEKNDDSFFESFSASEINEVTIDEAGKYSDFIFDGDDIENSISKLNVYLEDKGEMPKDAQLFGIKEIKKIILKDDVKGSEYSKEKIESDYIIKYGQVLNNTKVSNLSDGSYMNIYVEDNKISMIDMNWLTLKKTDSPKNIIRNDSLMNNTKIEKKIIDIQNEYFNINGSKPELVKRELVYVKNNENEMVLRWQLKFKDFTITVD